MKVSDKPGKQQHMISSENDNKDIVRDRRQEANCDFLKQT